MVENLTTLIKSGKYKIHNVDDVTEKAIRQFEDYGFDISDKGKTITYSNMTAGGHDDFVSASYFAVADVTATDIDEMVNFYSDNNFFISANKYNVKSNVKNGFF